MDSAPNVTAQPPSVAERALAEVAEVIATSELTGTLASRLVERMVAAAHAGDTNLAFRIEDLVREIHRRHDEHVRRAPFLAGVRRVGDTTLRLFAVREGGSR